MAYLDQMKNYISSLPFTKLTSLNAVGESNLTYTIQGNKATASLIDTSKESHVSCTFSTSGDHFSIHRINIEELQEDCRIDFYTQAVGRNSSCWTVTRDKLYKLNDKYSGMLTVIMIPQLPHGLVIGEKRCLAITPYILLDMTRPTQNHKYINLRIAKGSPAGRTHVFNFLETSIYTAPTYPGNLPTLDKFKNQNSLYQTADGKIYGMGALATLYGDVNRNATRSTP